MFLQRNRLIVIDINLWFFISKLGCVINLRDISLRPKHLHNYVWLDFTSFSALLFIYGCLCHIVLKWGIPVSPLLMWNVSLISKEIDSKSLLGFGQGSHPWPPSPKANTLAHSHHVVAGNINVDFLYRKFRFFLYIWVVCLCHNLLDILISTRVRISIYLIIFNHNGNYGIPNTYRTGYYNLTSIVSRHIIFHIIRYIRSFFMTRGVLIMMLSQKPINLFNIKIIIKID